MKSLILFISFLSCSLFSFSQAYIPIPIDSPAAWRYRLFDVDNETTVYDISIFLNGMDTVSGGNTYHQLSIRSHMQVVSGTTVPPVVSCAASTGDFYYGAIRETGKKVYMLSGSIETLIYDFNVNIGDSILGSLSKVKVTAIDSIAISGVYHKQYHTSDPGFTAIEGVGSTRGLNPPYNDGSGIMQFHCFSNGPVVYTPSSTIPCTAVYPIWFSVSAPASTLTGQIDAYPVPTSKMLHITVPPGSYYNVHAYDVVGKQVWTDAISGSTDINISTWPKGIYLLHFTGNAQSAVKKVVVE